MPDYFPEGDTPLAQDTRWRSYQKICSLLYATFGNKGPSYYPEGSAPQPGDDIKRLQNKINALNS